MIGRGLALAAAAALVVCTSGCATGSRRMTAERLVRLESIGVAPAGEPTHVSVWALTAKTGAEEGAVDAIQIATLLTMGLWPIAFYGAGTVAVPAFGAMVGSAVGAINAPSDPEYEKVQRALHGVFENADVMPKLRSGVVEGLRRDFPDKRIVTLDPLPDVPREERFVGLEDRDLDAVLQIRLTDVEVSGPWGTPWDGSLQIWVDLELVRLEDGFPVFTGTFSELRPGDAEELGEWWEGDTEELQGALDDAVSNLATTLVEALVGLEDELEDQPNPYFQ